ncbi:MAG: acetylornithine/succinyldiaminopimelate/putrescine aminotransferase [Paracoccaceae bacterium]|jgi:acetylornithine/succinyldiaminopimelate/putrescine aminotransferase
MIPKLKTAIPGPRSRALVARLREYESRNVTYQDNSWPVFWEEAHGTNVWDADGNRFLDFTSAFGVAGLGHRNTEIVEAMQQQSGKLLHGMGDVHPTALKGELCARLSALTFERWLGTRGKVVLSNSGFEAVETALKTARLVTGKPGVMAFGNGYHGLGYGSLLGTDLAKFRGPFTDQLAEVTTRVPFGSFDLPDGGNIGAVLVEPIQGRGGKVLPPPGFLEALREWCDEHGAVLIFDEIYTGFHRSGKWFACEWDEVVPDLICVGKALSGGFPISACVGKAEVMDAWPESPGEALHTSTFLGNPVGCAMALKSLEILERPETLAMAAAASTALEAALGRLQSKAVVEIRGRGLMWGVELQNPAGPLLAELLAQGLLFLADGPEGNVLSFTPPFTISEEELEFGLEIIQNLLKSN